MRSAGGYAGFASPVATFQPPLRGEERHARFSCVECAAQPHEDSEYCDLCHPPTAGEHPIVEGRKLFRNAVRLLHAAPRIQVTAPANVEAVITDDPATRTLRVHFIAYNPTPQTTPDKNRPFILPGLVEDAPMFKATIVLDQSPRDAQALNPTTHLDRRQNQLDLIISDSYNALGRHAGALKLHEESLRIAPKCAAAHSGLAWILANCAEAKLRDPGRALQHAREAEELLEVTKK